MADTDLLFSIIAQDEYSAKLQEARAQVDALTETEKQAIVVSTQHQSVETQMANAYDLSSEAKQRATDQLTKLDDQYKAGEISLKQYTEGVDSIKAGLESESKAIGDVTEAQDKASQSGSNWAITLTGINQGIQVAQTILEKFKQAWDFAKEGAAIQRIGSQFQQVAEDFGASGDEMVAAMDKAAHGTVDDEELMQTATRAMTQGTVESQDQLVRFTEIARASAVRFGGDTAQALQSILYATEVGAARQLKATIGVVDFTKSYEDLAKQLGKRKEDLTDEEQLQARVNAVLDKGAELVKKVGDAGEDALTKMQRFETTAANVFDEFKSGATNAVLPYLDDIKILTTLNDDNATKMDQLRASYELAADTFGKDSTLAQRLKEEIDKLGQAEQAAAQDAYGQSGALDESARAARRAEEAQAQLADQLRRAQAYTSDYADATDRATRRTQELAAADATARDTLVSSDLLAVQYTQTEEKRADIVAKIEELDSKIAANGPVRTAQIANQKMSEEQRALTLQKLAVAQEDITQIQRKAGETDAEYALKVETAKQKVDALSASLGTHTVTLGGATKAQLDQRDALQKQLDEFDRANEIQRATDVFNAVADAIKKGTLSADEGSARLEALNSVSHLYSATALETAKSQLTLLASLTDPKSKDWEMQLYKNQSALDGVTQAEQEATDKANALARSDTLSKQTEAASKYREELGKIPADVKTVVTVEVKTAGEAIQGAAGDSIAERAAQARASGALADTSKSAASATDQIKTASGEAIDSIHKMVAPAASDISSVADKAKTKLSDVSAAVIGAFQNMGIISRGEVNSVQNAIDKLPTFKEFIYKITVKGEIPDLSNLPSGNTGGEQHAAGVDMIIPPNYNDNYPLGYGKSGERFLVLTPEQQQAQAMSGSAQINHNETINLYDTLVTRQVAEQRRIDALKSITGAM